MRASAKFPSRQALRNVGDHDTTEIEYREVYRKHE